MRAGSIALLLLAAIGAGCLDSHVICDDPSSSPQDPATVVDMCGSRLSFEEPNIVRVEAVGRHIDDWFLIILTVSNATRDVRITFGPGNEGDTGSGVSGFDIPLGDFHEGTIRPGEHFTMCQVYYGLPAKADHLVTLHVGFSSYADDEPGKPLSGWAYGRFRPFPWCDA